MKPELLLLALALLISTIRTPPAASAAMRIKFTGFTGVETSLMRHRLENTIGKYTKVEQIDSIEQDGDITVQAVEGNLAAPCGNTRRGYIQRNDEVVQYWIVQINKDKLEQIHNSHYAIRNKIVHEIFHVIDFNAPHSTSPYSVFNGGVNSTRLVFSKRDRRWLKRRL